MLVSGIVDAHVHVSAVGEDSSFIIANVRLLVTLKVRKDVEARHSLDI
jgi:hypothetical protein